jgi:hypothetical protein
MSDYEELIERLRNAQDIVNRAQIDEPLRPAAFSEAARALERSTENRQRATDRGDRNGAERAGTRNRSRHADDGRSDRLAAIAEAFGIDTSLLDQLFAEDGDALLFVLSPRHLASTTRGGMRQIAILTTCARQAGGWDEAWTSSATLRDECKRVGIYSDKHFNTVLETLDMFGSQGSGSNRQLRAHSASYEAARTVLRQIGLMPDEPDS